MPKRSKVEMLPDDVRKQLDHRIRFNRYSHYEVIARWLTSEGHPIGKSALAAYGLALMKKDKVKPSAKQPVRNKIGRDWRRLPVEIQRELAGRLQAGGWDDHVGNAVWLQERGHPIGVAAVETFARDLTGAVALRHAMELLG